MSEHHFATALVIMGSYNAASSAVLEARYRHLTYAHELKKAGPFSTLFVVLYAGVDSAVLKTAGGPVCYMAYHILSNSGSRPTLRSLTGPRAEISKAFAAWHVRAEMDGEGKAGPNHILYQLDGEYGEEDFSSKQISDPTDKLVLEHPGPPAKHYGFEILFVEVSIDLRASQELSNGSDDGDQYYGYSPDNFSLRDDWDGEADTEWQFTSLDGVPIDGDSELEEQLHEELVNQKGHVYNRYIDLLDETGKSSRVDQDGDVRARARNYVAQTNLQAISENTLTSAYRMVCLF